jgi:hypothetical protein
VFVKDHQTKWLLTMHFRAAVHVQVLLLNQQTIIDRNCCYLLVRSASRNHLHQPTNCGNSRTSAVVAASTQQMKRCKHTGCALPCCNRYSCVPASQEPEAFPLSHQAHSSTATRPEHVHLHASTSTSRNHPTTSSNACDE